MRLGILIVSSLVLAAARPSFPTCGDQAADAQAVADTRAAAASECDCAAAASHASYADCVVRVANAAASRAAPATTTTTLRPRCGSDLDCDDGNGCSVDRCIDGTCQHECVCVGPGGSASCCPGPAAQCPSPRWFYTCGDPVCGGHRDQGVPPCSSETPG